MQVLRSIADFIKSTNNGFLGAEQRGILSDEMLNLDLIATLSVRQGKLHAYC
jgi:hypothetical protein